MPSSLMPLKPPTIISRPPCVHSTRCGARINAPRLQIKSLPNLLHWALFCPLKDAVSRPKTPDPIVSPKAIIEQHTRSYEHSLDEKHIARTADCQRFTKAFCNDILPKPSQVRPVQTWTAVCTAILPSKNLTHYRKVHSICDDPLATTHRRRVKNGNAIAQDGLPLFLHFEAVSHLLLSLSLHCPRLHTLTRNIFYISTKHCADGFPVTCATRTR